MTQKPIGRPNLSGNYETKSPVLTLRLQQKLWDKVEDVAKKEGVHRNQVIRAAIDAYVHGRVAGRAPLGDYDMPKFHHAVRGEVSENDELL